MTDKPSLTELTVVEARRWVDNWVFIILVSYFYVIKSQKKKRKKETSDLSKIIPSVNHKAHGA